MAGWSKEPLEVFSKDCRPGFGHMEGSKIDRLMSLIYILNDDLLLSGELTDGFRNDFLVNF